jgi:hypothetical protein
MPWSEWTDENGKFDEEKFKTNLEFHRIVYGPPALRKIDEMIETVANLHDDEFEHILNIVAYFHCWGDGHGYDHDVPTYGTDKFDITDPTSACGVCKARVQAWKFVGIEDLDDEESEYGAIKFAMGRMNKIMMERLTNLGVLPASQGKYKIAMMDAILGAYIGWYLQDGNKFDMVGWDEHHALIWPWKHLDILHNLCSINFDPMDKGL